MLDTARLLQINFHYILFWFNPDLTYFQWRTELNLTSLISTTRSAVLILLITYEIVVSDVAILTEQSGLLNREQHIRH